MYHFGNRSMYIGCTTRDAFKTAKPGAATCLGSISTAWPPSRLSFLPGWSMVKSCDDALPASTLSTPSLYPSSSYEMII